MLGALRETDNSIWWYSGRMGVREMAATIASHCPSWYITLSVRCQCLLNSMCGYSCMVTLQIKVSGQINLVIWRATCQEICLEGCPCRLWAKVQVTPRTDKVAPGGEMVGVDPGE